MDILFLVLLIFAILFGAAAGATVILSLENYIRQRQNLPRHLKPEPTTPTVKEAIKND